MADFPPNLEDGELWLPSQIIDEITYSTDLPPQKNLSVSPPPPLPATLSPHLPFNEFRVHNGYMGANYLGEYHVTSGGCFYSDHYNGWATPYGGFQWTPPPMKQHITQGLKEKGGTGVFIPRAVSAKCEKKSNYGAVGVLLNNHRKNKKGGKSEGAFKSSKETKSAMKEGGLTKKDKSQSQLRKFCLKDWTY